MADERTDKLLRKSFQEIKTLRATLSAREEASAEPIAIVGMACRTPGGASDPEGYWQLLDEGRDAIRPFPARWRPEEVYDPDPDAVGKSYTREGGYLDDVEDFDADFFGISPKEALQMDPQQRLALEVAWEALEHAGVVPESLRDSRTGVYVGAMPGDYGVDSFSLEGLDGYHTTGAIGSVISGRISYLLGLHGPSMTIDTACSSSLAALHLAVNALRQRECDLALGAGVTVMSTPSLFVEFSRLRASSPDGRCKAFSAEANGAAWAEGCGAVVLKRLSDAQRDGDRVLAVVRATAVNQDGRSQGLTAPNGPSQARLIRQALAGCKLEPADLDAIEAHGTGTRLGDPIEAGALAEVFADGRPAGRPLWLGSAKSNIGHAQAAAGVLGLIKMVLALEHGKLPRTLHAEQPSEDIAWDGSGLRLLQQSTEWSRNPERPRRAGVSSFGISGTNAHVILEEAPEPARRPTFEPPAVPLLLSGRDQAALRAQAARWAGWFSQDPSRTLPQARLGAALERTHFATRAAVCAADREQTLEALHALANGHPDARVRTGRARERRGLAFVFSGHGSQWRAMGRALIAQSPAAAQAIRACDAALRAHTDWSVQAVLCGESPDTDAIEVVQPCLFAMALGLAAAWRSLGIEPAAVVGHSQGEVAAAVVSGALSVEEGARIVALRSRLLSRLTGSGAMVSVELPSHEVEALLAEPNWEDLSMAVVNTTTSTVVAGRPERIEAFAAALEARQVFCRRVAVECAGHSADMDALLPELGAGLQGLAPRAGDVPMISTVTGERVAGETLDADYWCRNLREPVRLDRALARLLETGHDVFVEVSPHPVLGVALEGACAEREAVSVGSLERETGGFEAMLQKLAQLHLAGVDVDWHRVLGGAPRTPYALPTYAFQRTRYWRDGKASARDLGAAGLEATSHPLLGARLSRADGGALWSGRLSAAQQVWLGQHGVHGVALLPGTGLLELALGAGGQLGANRVIELDLEVPLALHAQGARVLQVEVSPAQDGVRRVAIHSRPEQDGSAWTTHATGKLAVAAADVVSVDAVAAWPPPAAQPVALAGLYERLTAAGYLYGPAFRGLREVWRSGECIHAQVEAPESLAGAMAGFGVHPALLDAALHALFATELELAEGQLWLPVGFRGVASGASGAETLRITITPAAGQGTSEREYDVRALDDRGRPALSGRVQVRRVESESLRRSLDAPAENLHALAWRALGAAPTVLDAGRTVVCTADVDLARALSADASPSVAALQRELDAGAPAPARLVIECAPASDALPAEAVHRQAETALADLQRLLSDARLAASELVWLVRGDGLPRRLTAAALGGLLRTARHEHPERRLRLIEVCEPGSGWFAWLRGSDEPELRVALHGAEAPRLVTPTPSSSREPGFDGDRTVLLSGGLGELGRLLADHLVREHGVKHLLITSRRADVAEGAGDLIASLRQAGACSVEVAHCDVTCREQLESLLSALPEGRPLGAVLHLAAVVEDRPLEGLEAATLHRVLQPKVDGALLLHELTRGHDLTHFVVFSSIAGVIGTLGQAAYAAANACLDALVDERRRLGLPAQSLAWGLWSPAGTGPTARLQQADLSRMARQGVLALEGAEGLALLDAALSRPEAHLVPARLDLVALSAAQRAKAGPPALLSEQLGAAGEDEGVGQPLRERVFDLPAGAREQALLEAVREAVAAVLHRAEVDAIDVDVPLRDMGLDSLMSVELKNRLSRTLDESLPAALAFNHPTVRAIAGFLLGRLEAAAPLAAPAPEPAQRWDEQAVRRKLRNVSLDALRQSGLLDALMAQPDAEDLHAGAGDSDVHSLIEDVSEEDALIEMAERLLGGER